MLTLIALPGNFMSSTTQVIGELLSDFSPVWILAFSLVVVVILIEVFINAMRPK